MQLFPSFISDSKWMKLQKQKVTLTSEEAEAEREAKDEDEEDELDEAGDMEFELEAQEGLTMTHLGGEVKKKAVFNLNKSSRK